MFSPAYEAAIMLTDGRHWLWEVYVEVAYIRRDHRPAQTNNTCTIRIQLTSAVYIFRMAEVK